MQQSGRWCKAKERIKAAQMEMLEARKKEDARKSKSAARRETSMVPYIPAQGTQDFYSFFFIYFLNQIY